MSGLLQHGQVIVEETSEKKIQEKDTKKLLYGCTSKLS